MPESSIRNLAFSSQSMGQIIVQPVTLEPKDLEAASLVIYPEKISKETIDVGVEWAAGTQTPIFCGNSDVERFEQEGFGAYRFLKLDGYREVDFQGGAVEFFPAQQKKVTGLRGLLGTSMSRLMMGKARSLGFHFMLKPKGELPILFLASTQVDSQEWSMFMKANPSHVVGSATYTKSEWHAFSTHVKRRVFPAQEMAQLKTVARGTGQADSVQRENPLWAVRTGSL